MLWRRAADARSGIRPGQLHAIRGSLCAKEREKNLVPLHGQDFSHRRARAGARGAATFASRVSKYAEGRYASLPSARDTRGLGGRGSKIARRSHAVAPRGKTMGLGGSGAALSHRGSGYLAGAGPGQNVGADGEGGRVAGKDRATFRNALFQWRANHERENARGAVS